MQIEPVEAPLNSGTEPISWTSLGHRSDWYIFPNYWTRSGQRRIPVRFHLWGFPLSSGHRSFDWFPGQRWCNFSTWTPCLRRSLPNQLGLKWLHQNTWSQTLLCLGLVQCFYTNFQPIHHFWFVGKECYWKKWVCKTLNFLWFWDLAVNPSSSYSQFDLKIALVDKPDWQKSPRPLEAVFST